MVYYAYYKLLTYILLLGYLVGSIVETSANCY